MTHRFAASTSRAEWRVRALAGVAIPALLALFQSDDRALAVGALLVMAAMVGVLFLMKGRCAPARAEHKPEERRASLLVLGLTVVGVVVTLVVYWGNGWAVVTALLAVVVMSIALLYAIRRHLAVPPERR
ncbi:MAG: hypothetical protein ACOYEV_05710 [Candidatus Nanopelagicales bacterium]